MENLFNTNNDIKKYLKDSANFNKSIIFVTNLEKILFCSNEEYNNILINKEYKNEIINMYNNNEVAKVFNCYKINIIKPKIENIQNEVIMLILKNDKTVGSLVMLNHNLNFEVSNFTFSSTILNVLKSLIN